MILDIKTIPMKVDLVTRIKLIRLIVFDFDGVFTDNMVYVSQDGIETVKCFRGDGYGLKKLESIGISSLIISSEENPVVSTRSSKLGIRCIQSVKDKLSVLISIIKELELTEDQVAFVGNDINDLSCLTSVGLPIVVKDAHADVISHALYITQTCGGYGAVREVCDLFEYVCKNFKEN